jgi:hypothetical protein
MRLFIFSFRWLLGASYWLLSIGISPSAKFHVAAMNCDLNFEQNRYLPKAKITSTQISIYHTYGKYHFAALKSDLSFDQDEIFAVGEK